MRCVILTCLLIAFSTHGFTRPWSDDVIYFVMTDRFLDGDPGNNNPQGCEPALHDPEQRDISRYMGGDLRGLEKAISAGYFTDLGVTALWMTPVVKNVWCSGYEHGEWKTGYHGYWTQDWLDIDPHLTSSTSLDGTPYPQGPEGRMRHYSDFVALAHSKGIKVIQDVVLNHAGPVFYYDANGDGSFDVREKEEWLQPFRWDGYHNNAKWADIPEWNARRAQPDGPRQLLETTIPTKGILSRLEAYGRKGYSDNSLGKSDGEEVMSDFFSLRDLWTAPDGKFFDELVDDFVEIHAFYLQTVGVDGLRIDTVKHVHHGFLDAFTSRLRKRLGPDAGKKLIFGEVYDGNPSVLGRYTWRSDWPKSKEPGLDAVLDFHTCFSARRYLRHNGEQFGSAFDLEKALATRSAEDSTAGRPFYNPTPGPDGLNSRQKMITFIENHDDLNRFRVDQVSESRNRLAQGLVMTLPGIPCLYYGTEFALHDPDGRIDRDAKTGRLMLFTKSRGPTVAEIRQSESFREIRRLADLRKQLPVLRTGNLTPLWVDSGESHEDDGIFAFARASPDGEKFAVIVINASQSMKFTGAGSRSMQLPDSLKTVGKELRLAATIGGAGPEPTKRLPASGRLRLTVPASCMQVYESVARE